MPYQGGFRHNQNMAGQNNATAQGSVLTQAAECTARGAVPGPVVLIGDDCMSCMPGPNAKHYEASRTAAGAHLLFNAFWLVTNFCIFQMPDSFITTYYYKLLPHYYLIIITILLPYFYHITT